MSVHIWDENDFFAGKYERKRESEPEVTEKEVHPKQGDMTLTFKSPCGNLTACFYHYGDFEEPRDEEEEPYSLEVETSDGVMYNPFLLDDQTIAWLEECLDYVKERF